MGSAVTGSPRRGFPIRGDAGPAGFVSPAAAATTTRAPLILSIMIIAILLPQEAAFFVGDTRMSVARLILFLAFPLVVGRFVVLLFQRPGTNIADVAVLLAAAWWMIAAMNNTISATNPRWVFFAGSGALELCVSYLLVRVFVLTTAQARATLEVFCLAVAVVGFLGIVDVLAGDWIIRATTAAFTGVPRPWVPDDNWRLGLSRASSTIEHPILFGTLCAIAGIIALNAPMRWRVFILAGCLTGVITSVSSGAFLALFLGIGLTIYSRLPLWRGGRWALMLAALGGALATIFLVHPNPWGFLFEYMTFSPETGYFRYLIWQTYLPIVWDYPIFGFGDSQVLARTAGMSPTVDAHWLNLMLLMGIPGMVLTAAMSLCSCSVNTNNFSSQVLLRAQVGLALGISIGIYVFVGFTVFYWGTLFIVGSMLAGLRSAIGSAAATDAAYPGMDRAG